MMGYKPDIEARALILLLCFLLPPVLPAADIPANECRPLKPAKTDLLVQTAYGEGLLWEINRQGIQPSYVFGTIHVSDPDITNLPEKVSDTLTQSGQFIMEALPEPDEVVKLTQMMFFNDGRRLDEFIAQPLFDRTIEILASYQIPREAVLLMKPWAAFMVMNYPPGNDLPLDLKLLSIAQVNGIEINGLESLQEQGKIFDNLTLATQLGLLIDTVCHYDLVLEDFEHIKSLYIKRDLKGLYEISRHLSVSDERIYQELISKLLTTRNVTMVERMQPILEKGNAFIAIGALHLIGDDGVLSLLEQKGYAIKLIY
jgi:uncharacterized protein YbaP (TraB family)